VRGTAVAALVLAIMAGVSEAAAEPALMVYRGAGCTGRDALPAFEGFVGRRVDGVVDFLAGGSWEEMQASARWIAGCWSGGPRELVLSVPMLPRGGEATLQAGAAGAYDAQFAEMARTLVAAGRADAMLRLGWEFNGDWYPWSAVKDPDAYAAYFRRIVQAMRAVDGARFRFVWNPNIGPTHMPADEAYPGDDVVDVIAADVFNQSWRPADKDPLQRWLNLHRQPYGLAWLEEFARGRGKPVAIPEWGTGDRPDGHGFGDDGAFVRGMAAWIASSGAVFHGYWDYRAPDYDAEISGGRFPEAGAAFRTAFGRAPPQAH
jgi:hypothetical protein